MAPVPKKKHTRRRSNLRKHAATERISLANASRCPNCKGLKLSHKACPNCGYYKQSLQA